MIRAPPRFPLPFAPPPNFPQAAQSRNHISGILTGCQVQLKKTIFLSFKEQLDLEGQIDRGTFVRTPSRWRRGNFTH